MLSPPFWEAFCLVSGDRGKAGEGLTAVLVAGLRLLVLGPDRRGEASLLLRLACPLPLPRRFPPLLTPTRHLLSPQLQQKAVASEIFKGKKDNYPQSVPRLFISTRLGEPLTFSAPTLRPHPPEVPSPSSDVFLPHPGCRCR